MTYEQRMAVLESCVTKLSECYDAVQIMGTFLTPDNRTIGHKRGSGNWYARQGMAQQFVQDDEAESHAIQIAAKLDPPDESWKT